MTVLFLGLIIFLGVHSVRMVADGWRAAQVARLGPGLYKGLYSALSIGGFALLCWGFGLARQQPVMLWDPPMALRHVAALLMLVSFVLLAAAYVPRNGIKARVHHPMILSVKTWALAHLLANGNLAHLVLFGSFLVWAVFDFSSARRRDRVAGTVYAAGTTRGTALTLVIGVAAWAVFAIWLHGWLIGVRPLG